MRATIPLTLGVLALLVGAPPAKGMDEDRVFRSFTAEYYRRFYAQAAAEAMVPGEHLTTGERGELHAKLRRRSKEWADALEEVLELKADGTFEFRFRDIAGVAKGTAYLDAVPTGARCTRSGRWMRSDSDLTLSVAQIGSQILPEPIDWHMSWVGAEILIPTWREGFGPSILHLDTSLGPPDARLRRLAWELEDLERRAQELAAALAALRGRLGAATGASRSSHEARGPQYWLDLLRSDDESLWLTAVIELGRLRAVEASADLMRIVQDTRGGDARLAAAFTLGEWMVLDAVPILIGLLTDEDALIRAAATDALRSITECEMESEGDDEASLRAHRRRWEVWWHENEETVRSRVERR